MLYYSVLSSRIPWCFEDSKKDENSLVKETCYVVVRPSSLPLLVRKPRRLSEVSTGGSFFFPQFASCCTARSMNYSNLSSLEDLPTQTTFSIEKTLAWSLLSFVTSLAIIGNIFILICIIGNAALQRPGHLFIASLALADLILALTVMVPRLSDEILGGWHFGHFLCQVSKWKHNLVTSMLAWLIRCLLEVKTQWDWCANLFVHQMKAQFIFGALIQKKGLVQFFL